ncbi:terminase gpP N-terminus-related DNA-binding protein, partial [Nostoc flagelliforme]
HGYFRTPIAIATKLWALGYSTSPFLDNYSSAEIARVLCVHSTTVSGWVRRGWLKTSRRSSKRYQVRRWHLKSFFENPPQHLKKRIASIDSEAINYLLGRKA